VFVRYAIARYKKRNIAVLCVENRYPKILLHKRFVSHFESLDGFDGLEDLDGFDGLGRGVGFGVSVPL